MWLNLLTMLFWESGDTFSAEHSAIVQENNREYSAQDSFSSAYLSAGSKGKIEFQPDAKKAKEEDASEDASEDSVEEEESGKRKRGLRNRERRKRLKNGEELSVANSSDVIIPGIRWETLIKNENKEVYAQEQIWKEETIQRYLDQTDRIVIGTIIEHRLLNANLGLDVVMEVEVEDYLLGEGDIYLTIDVPYVAPFVPGKPETVAPVVVDSYRMLIFIDRHRRVVEGNAMFVLEGEYAWRNKRPDVFLNPRYDRDWSMESPIPDYVMFSMSEVLEAIASHNEEQPFWRRRVFTGFSFD